MNPPQNLKELWERVDELSKLVLTDPKFESMSESIWKDIVYTEMKRLGLIRKGSRQC